MLFIWKAIKHGCFVWKMRQNFMNYIEMSFEVNMFESIFISDQNQCWSASATAIRWLFCENFSVTKISRALRRSNFCSGIYCTKGLKFHHFDDRRGQMHWPSTDFAFDLIHRTDGTWPNFMGSFKRKIRHRFFYNLKNLLFWLEIL